VSYACLSRAGRAKNCIPQTAAMKKVCAKGSFVARDGLFHIGDHNDCIHLLKYLIKTNETKIDPNSSDDRATA
jgi:hypothetical protein